MTDYIPRDALTEARNLAIRAYENANVFNADAIRENLKPLLNAVLDAPAADVAEVVHGEWVYTDKHLWYKNEDGSIDEWRLDIGFHNGPECEVCGMSFCMHCNPDYEDTKCEIGHYVCSKCGKVSRDGREKYCPNCGTKMDGENNNVSD